MEFSYYDCGFDIPNRRSDLSVMPSMYCHMLVLIIVRVQNYNLRDYWIFFFFPFQSFVLTEKHEHESFIG